MTSISLIEQSAYYKTGSIFLTVLLECVSISYMDGKTVM